MFTSYRGCLSSLTFLTIILILLKILGSKRPEERIYNFKSEVRLHVLVIPETHVDYRQESCAH